MDVTFARLCGQPLGVRDYWLSLTGMILRDIPVLDDTVRMKLGG